MWLLGRLIPDHKTIADFRKDNGAAIRKVCAQFIALCRAMGLLTQASVAIDGSKFKAVNNRDKNFTRAKMERRTAQIEESVARYLEQLDTADRQEPSEALANEDEPPRKRRLSHAGSSEMRRLERLKVRRCWRTPDQQISLTDPDSPLDGDQRPRFRRRSATTCRLPSRPNHHLIVTHEVTNDGTQIDRNSPTSLANETKAALGVDELDAVADRGYFNSEEIRACEEAGITVTLAKADDI